MESELSKHDMNIVLSSSQSSSSKRIYSTQVLTQDTVCVFLTFLSIDDLISLLRSNVMIEIPNEWWIAKGRDIFQSSFDIFLKQSSFKYSDDDINENESNPVINQLSNTIQLLLHNNTKKNKNIKSESVNFMRDLRLYNYSSIDRVEEKPHNMLQPSSCLSSIELKVLDFNFLSPTQLGIRSQIICGCAASEPCYWSSAPSSHDNMKEFVEFESKRMTSRACRSITGMSVTCYQAFCHPNAPIYAPKFVRMELSHPLSNSNYNSNNNTNTNKFYKNKKEEGEEEEENLNDDEKNDLTNIYWKSEYFPVDGNSRIPQRFSFAFPALFFGESKVKIKFKGAQQRQTLKETGNEDFNEDFYICISHLELISDVNTNEILEECTCNLLSCVDKNGYDEK